MTLFVRLLPRRLLSLKRRMRSGAAAAGDLVGWMRPLCERELMNVV